ncbi:hypothetical protein GCM10027089_00880 [Nocardia thraciensis]
MQFRSSDPALWSSLFRECRRDAFYLETRDSYSVPHEAERLRCYLNGEPPPSTKTPWHDLSLGKCRRMICNGVRNRLWPLAVPYRDYY